MFKSVSSILASVLVLGMIALACNSTNNQIQDKVVWSDSLGTLNARWKSVEHYENWQELLGDNRYDECVLNIDLINAYSDIVYIGTVGGTGIYSEVVRSYYKDGTGRGAIQDGSVDNYLKLDVNDTVNMIAGVFECRDTTTIDSVVLLILMRRSGVDGKVNLKIVNDE